MVAKARNKTDENFFEDENAFVQNYQVFVRSIAKELYAKMSHLMEYEDLVAYGNFGLVQAMRGFDENRGSKFISYAALRIKGAMLDAIQEQNRCLRSQRRTGKGSIPITISLDSAVGENGETLEGVVTSVSSCSAEDIVFEHFPVIDKLNCLSRKERLVMQYLLEGFSQREIAVCLGLDPTRISQLKIRATNRLRAYYAV